MGIQSLRSGVLFCCFVSLAVSVVTTEVGAQATGDLVFSSGFENGEAGLLFEENFDSLASGSIDGQNGWSVAGAGSWQIVTEGAGNVVSQTLTVAEDLFFLNNITNGAPDFANYRLVVDFRTPTLSFAPQLWLRKTSALGDGGGYLLFHNQGSWEIATHPPNTGASFDSLATVGFPIMVDTWYTLEFEVIDNDQGNPVLSARIYLRGESRPVTPQISVTDSGNSFLRGWFGLGVNNTPLSYDNVRVVAVPQASDALRITVPARSVSAAPNVATLAITDEDGTTFHIPYIQTDSTLVVSAEVGQAVLPSQGGVQFVLDQGLSSQQSVVDLQRPFEVSFTGLAKGNYSLNAFVVDAEQMVVAGSQTRDEVVDIGVGDIIIAIGDSITEGWNGVNYDTTPITDWLQAPPAAVSSDRRNYPQHGPQLDIYRVSFLNELNDALTAAYGYPVFIMNEGRYAYDADEYISYMAQSQWRSRSAALRPNKWLIHLGANDAWVPYDATTFRANLQTIVDTLISEYAAVPAAIWLAQPAYHFGDTEARAVEATYLPEITSLIDVSGLSAGPDFFSYYQLNAIDQYDDGIHPNVAGFSAMAQLWAETLTQ